MASLVEKLEAVAAANDDAGMHVVVNFVGVAPDAIRKFADGKELKHVVFTAVDDDNAAKFDISEDAALTVMHYRNKTVSANHAVAAGKLDDDATAAIIESTDMILSEPDTSKPRRRL